MSGPAVALTVEFIALESVRALRVTIAGLTALSAGNLPVVDFASVARLSHHIGKAWALSGHRIARTGVLIGSQGIAHAFNALLSSRFAPKAGFADLAMGTSSVVQTPKTIACPRIAISRLRDINVIVTFALTTFPSRDSRFSEEVIITSIASLAGISSFAVADHVLSAGIEVAGVGVTHAAAGDARTGTGATRDRHLIHEKRITIIAAFASLTSRTGCEVTTIDANASLRITDLCVAIAVAPLTVGVIPKSWLTFIALSAISAGTTLALTTQWVAEVVQRSDAVTVASY